MSLVLTYILQLPVIVCQELFLCVFALEKRCLLYMTSIPYQNDPMEHISNMGCIGMLYCHQSIIYIASQLFVMQLLQKWSVLPYSSWNINVSCGTPWGGGSNNKVRPPWTVMYMRHFIYISYLQHLMLYGLTLDVFIYKSEKI